MSTKRLQVFLSSTMRRNVLKTERQAAREATKRLGFAWVLDWETCGHADCRPPMSACLEAVRESNALVLPLGRDLSASARLRPNRIRAPVLPVRAESAGGQT